jgi:hypothetical protein
MSSNLHDKQKSPKRRFLLLDVIRLICLVSAGSLIIILRDRINILSDTQKIIVGSLFIIYGVVRFTLSLKNQPGE